MIDDDRYGADRILIYNKLPLQSTVFIVSLILSNIYLLYQTELEFNVTIPGGE